MNTPPMISPEQPSSRSSCLWAIGNLVQLAAASTLATFAGVDVRLAIAISLWVLMVAPFFPRKGNTP